MNDVLRVCRNPYFCFPGYLVVKAAESMPVLKRCNEDQTRLAWGEQILQFLTSLCIDSAGAYDGFNQ